MTEEEILANPSFQLLLSNIESLDNDSLLRFKQMLDDEFDLEIFSSCEQSLKEVFGIQNRGLYFPPLAENREIMYKLCYEKINLILSERKE